MGMGIGIGMRKEEGVRGFEGRKKEKEKKGKRKRKPPNYSKYEIPPVHEYLFSYSGTSQNLPCLL